MAWHRSTWLHMGSHLVRTKPYGSGSFLNPSWLQRGQYKSKRFQTNTKTAQILSSTGSYICQVCMFFNSGIFFVSDSDLDSVDHYQKARSKILLFELQKSHVLINAQWLNVAGTPAITISDNFRKNWPYLPFFLGFNSTFCIVRIYALLRAHVLTLILLHKNEHFCKFVKTYLQIIQ